MVLIGLFSALLIPLTSLPDITRAGINNTRADPWGTTELAASGWLNGGSVAVYSNGATAAGPSPDTYNCITVSGGTGGLGCSSGTVPSGIEWQCVELVNRLYLTKGWTTATWTGNGNTLVNNVPASLTKQNNGSLSSLNPGDVITLDDGGLGHAAIINTVGSSIQIVNQNTPAVYSTSSIASGSLSLGNASLASPWFGYTVQAIVHAPSGNTAQPGLGGGNASSWGTGRLDGWVAQASSTSGSNLGHVYFDAASWQPWETIPSAQLMASQPAAVSWGVNRVDVFARGQAGDLIHDWFDSAGWHAWESLGGCLVGSPTVTSWGASRLDVLAQGCEPAGTSLWHRAFDGTAWQPWETVVTSAAMTASPSAVSWGQGRIDVFSRGTDASLIHAWYDATGWHPWESLGGCIVGSPAASSWTSGRVDAWAQGCSTTGANFWHTWYDSTGWHPWELVSSTQQIAGVLGATSWGPNRIDLFTRNADNTLAH